MKKCIDCSKEICDRAIRCKKCARQGKLHPMYGKKHTTKTREKMSKNHWNMSGKNHPMYGIRKFGKDNPFWKGGKCKFTLGYIGIRQKNGKYLYEHRLIMEKHIGRKLKRFEIIHHTNGVKTDNRIENLMLFNNQAEHRKWHGQR